MKLIYSSILLVYFTYKPIVQNVRYALTPINDISLLEKFTWEVDKISTDDIPSNEEYSSIIDEINNIPTCSLDDYINFDVNNNCVQYIRNEKCVQEEGDIEHYQLQFFNNELTLVQDNIAISFTLREISDEKLVLEIPLNYGETDYNYTITYRPLSQ